MLYKVSQRDILYFARMQSVQIKPDYSATRDAHGSFAKAYTYIYSTMVEVIRSTRLAVVEIPLGRSNVCKSV